MREIKFRAYDSINKVMEYDVNVNQGKPVKQGYQWFDKSNTVLHSDLMQYTGLNDKNGTPIYEGDIVEYKDYSGGAYLFSKQPLDRDVVKWNKSTGGYKVRGMGYTFNADKYEVIGNIHENPELLRGNKE